MAASSNTSLRGTTIDDVVSLHRLTKEILQDVVSKLTSLQARFLLASTRFGASVDDLINNWDEFRHFISSEWQDNAHSLDALVPKMVEIKALTSDCDILRSLMLSEIERNQKPAPPATPYDGYGSLHEWVITPFVSEAHLRFDVLAQKLERTSSRLKHFGPWNEFSDPRRDARVCVIQVCEIFSILAYRTRVATGIELPALSEYESRPLIPEAIVGVSLDVVDSIATQLGDILYRDIDAMLLRERDYAILRLQRSQTTDSKVEEKRSISNSAHPHVDQVQPAPFYFKEHLDDYLGVADRTRVKMMREAGLEVRDSPSIPGDEVILFMKHHAESGKRARAALKAKAFLESGFRFIRTQSEE